MIKTALCINILQEIKLKRDENRKFKINPEGPVNPLIGLLAHKLGLCYNMRMYSSGITPSYMDDSAKYKRSYSEDKGNDEFHRVFLILFSLNKDMTSIVVDDTLFFKEITRNSREMGIGFMAILTALSLGCRVSCRYEKSSSDNKAFIEFPSLNIKFIGQEERLRDVMDVFEYFSETAGFYNNRSILGQFLESKNFLIQSFLSVFLDGREEMELFFYTLFNIVKEEAEILDRCFVPLDHLNPINCELAESMIRIMESFPFSEMNPPPIAKAIPAFYRSRNELLGERSGYTDDCTEVMLLRLIRCLLYDQENLIYSTDHLGNPSEDLVKFLKEHGRSSPPLSSRYEDDWSRVVEDLEDPNIVYSNVCSGSRNGIHEGFINLFLVLREICGLAGEDFRNCILDINRREILLEKRGCLMRETVIDNDQKNGVNVVEEFKKSFEKVISALKYKNKGICFKYGELLVQGEKYFEGKNRYKYWDICGTITIYIDEGVFQVKVRISNSNNASKIEFGIGIRKDTKEALNGLFKSDNNILTYFTKHYSRILNPISDKKMNELVKTNFYKGFLCGGLSNERHRMKVLSSFYERLKSEEVGSDTYFRIRDIMSNIIVNLDLNNLVKPYHSFNYWKLILIDNKFLTLLPAEHKISALAHAIYRGIYNETISSYLKEVCDLICHDGYYLSYFGEGIISWNNREALEILEKGGKLYPEVLISGFKEVLRSRKLNYCAKYFFKKMEKADIIRFGHKYNAYLEKNSALLDLLDRCNGRK